MRGRKAAKIELNEKLGQALEKLAARHTTGQQKAQGGRSILKAAAGKNQAELAQELKVSLDMTTLWRGRWLAVSGVGWDDLSVEERLEDLPRPGAASGLSADQVCQIEQMACEGPDKAGRPISHWTGPAIADERIKRGIVTYIWRRHAARLLKKGVSNRT